MQELIMSTKFIKNAMFAILTFLLIFFLLVGFALLLASQLTNIFGWISLILSLIIMEFLHRTSNKLEDDYDNY